MKIIKILSFCLAVSMLMAISPVKAAEQETEYVYAPIDLVEHKIANGDRLVTNNLFIDPSGVTWGIWGEDLLSLLTDTGEYNEGKSALWKNSWDEIQGVNVGSKTNRKTNTLTFNGVDYIISVPFDRTTGKTSTGTEALVIYSNQANTSVSPWYNNIDIPDGYYNGISMLGGGYNNSNGIIFRYVYDDGSKSNWQHLWCKNLGTNQKSSEGAYTDEGLDDYLEFNSYKAGEGYNTTQHIYLQQMHNIKADTTKKVVSLDFIASKATLYYNGKYDYTNSSGERPTSSSNSLNYSFQMVGMTMIQDYSCSISSLMDCYNNGNPVDEAALLSAYNNLAAKYEKLSSDDKDKFDSVTQYYNHKEIDKIAAELAKLPAVDELTAEDITKENSDLLDIINSMEEARQEKYSGVATDMAHQAVLDRLTEYNEKYVKVREELSEGYINDIEAIINKEGFPTPEELTNIESFTPDVINDIKQVAVLLKDVVYDVLSEQSKQSYDMAEKYVDRLADYYILYNDNILSETDKMLSDLPEAEDVTYTSAEKSAIYKLNKEWDSTASKLEKDYLTDTQKELCNKAEAYKALVSGLLNVSVPLSPDSFANMSTAYSSSRPGLADVSNTNVWYYINGEEWMKQDIWEESWMLDSSGTGDNTTIFNDIAYNIKAADSDSGITAAYIAQSEATVGYDTVDIENGIYSGISFLGGENSNGTTAGVGFKYTDGSISKFQKLSALKIYNLDSNAMVVPGKKYDNGSNTDYDLYLSQYTFENPEPEKEVDAILIPFRNASIDSDGVLKCEPTTGGTAYSYWGRWLGITMLQNYVDYCDDLSESFKKLEDMAASDISAYVALLDTAVKNAEIMGVDPSSLDGYELYLEKGKAYPRIIKYIRSSDITTASVSAVFGCDVNISADDVKLNDAEGNAVDFDFEYENKTAKISFTNDLDYSKTYVLSIDASVSAGNNILGSTAEYRFTIPTAAGFTAFNKEEADGELSVSYTFKNNMDKTSNALIIVCVCDKDGKIYDSFAKSEELLSGEEIKVSDEKLQIAEDYTLKVFCWDSLDGLNTVYKYNVN